MSEIATATQRWLRVERSPGRAHTGGVGGTGRIKMKQFAQSLGEIISSRDAEYISPSLERTFPRPISSAKMPFSPLLHRYASQFNPVSWKSFNWPPVLVIYSGSS